MRITWWFTTTAIFLVFSECGTISDTDTKFADDGGCRVEGKVRSGDSMAVVNAIVLLHDQNPSAASGLGKRSTPVRSAKTTTDGDGHFIIDSVDTGNYLIEVNDRSINGKIFRVSIDTADTQVDLQGTIASLGCLAGKINTTVFDMEKHAYAYVPEIGRIVKIDSCGTFILTGIPAWDYHLRIMKSDSVVPLLTNSSFIPVPTGDTIHIELIESKSGFIAITDTTITDTTITDTTITDTTITDTTITDTTIIDTTITDTTITDTTITDTTIIDTTITDTTITDTTAGESSNKPDSNLLAYYPFNGNANDESGHGFNATVMDATLTTDRFGNANRAYLFNGSAGIVATVDSSFSVTKFTMTAWIKHNGIACSAVPRIVAIAEPDQCMGYYEFLYANGYRLGDPQDYSQKLICSLDNDNAEYGYDMFYSTHATATHVWQHAAITFDNGRLKFYIDGVLDNEIAVSHPITQFTGSAELQIGFCEGGGYFNGAIDNVRIYNRALDEIEINALHDLPAETVPADTGLLTF